MAEQEEGRLRSTGTAAVVVVEQRASQARAESMHKATEHCEPNVGRQKWSKVSESPLPKETSLSCLKNLHVPDLNFETIELSEIGTGSDTIDLKHQYVETTFPINMEGAVTSAVKRLETNLPEGAEPVLSKVCFEEKLPSEMDSEPDAASVFSRSGVAIADSFTNTSDTKSPTNKKPSLPVPLKMTSTVTKTSRRFDNTAEPIPLEVKSTMTKVIVVVDNKASDPIPLEAKSTMTSRSSGQKLDSVPLKATSTMTALPLELTLTTIPSGNKSTLARMSAPLEKSEDESGKDSVSKENEFQPTTQIHLEQIYDTDPLEVKSTVMKPLPKTVQPTVHGIKSTIREVPSPLRNKVEEEIGKDILEDDIQSELNDTRVSNWSYDQEAGGLPRTGSMSSRLSHAVRQLLCCGVVYSPPSEDDVSTSRLASGI